MSADLGKGVFQLVVDDRQLAKIDAAKGRVASATGGMASSTESASSRIRTGLGTAGKAAVALGSAYVGTRLVAGLTESGNAARTFQDQISGAASATGISVERLSTIAKGFRFIPPTVAAEGLKNLVQIQTAFGKTGEAALTAAQGQMEVAEAASVVLGVPVAQVVDGIASAYRGEFDSLQRVIPSITAKRIEDEAMAISGKKSTEALTGQEKAQAAQNIIMAEGARYTKQLGQNTDTAAAKQREAAASSEKAKIALGESLLPVMTRVSQVGAVVANAFAKLPAPVQISVVAFIGLASLVGTLTPALALLAPSLFATGAAGAASSPGLFAAAGGFLAITVAGAPLWAIILAIIAVVGLAIVVIKNWGSIMTFLGGVMSTVGAVIRAVWGFIKKAAFLALLPILAVVGLAIVVIKNWGSIMTFLGGVMSTVGAVISAVWAFLAAAIGKAAGIIGRAVGAVVGFFAALPGRVLSAVGSLIGGIAGFFGSVGGAASGAAGSIVGAVVGFFAGLPGRVLSAVGSLIGGIAGFFGSVGGAASGAAGRVIGDVAGVFAALPGRIIGAIGDLSGIGVDLIAGIARGIKGAAGKILDAIVGIIPGPIRKFLGVGSPARIAIPWGQALAAGIGAGILADGSAIGDALARVMPATLPAPDGASRALARPMGASRAERATGGTVRNYNVHIEGAGPVALDEAAVYSVLRRMEVLSA